MEDLRKIILVNALNNVLFSGIHKPILDIITHTTQLLQTKSHHSMLRMCARGLGVAILPEFIFDHFSSEFSKKLTKLKIKNSLQPIEYRTVYLKSRPHSEELSYFIEVMKYFSGDHKAEI